MSTTNSTPVSPFLDPANFPLGFPKAQDPVPQTPALAPATRPSPGRPRALNRYKCHQILNLVFRGCTIEDAARIVGCAASTIRREARRNPEFNEELSKMLFESELFALNAVRGAAHRHWRAGRFLLERMADERTRLKNRQPLDSRQLRKFTTAIVEALESEIEDHDYRQRISEHLKEVVRDTNRNMANNSRSPKPRRQKRNVSS